MATIQTMRAMPALVFTAVLLSTPAWADLGSRPGLPPVHSHQTGIVQEEQPPSAESRPMHHDALSPNPPKAGELYLISPGKGMEGPRIIANPRATFNSIRPDELQEHGAGGSGIPLWSW